MQRVLFILIILFYGVKNYAQTGIGTTTPDASAKLDVSSTNKGFLPPRVTLAATNSASPITNPANGLLVFNTVTAGTNPYQVVPGYYYWDATGLKWVSLSTTVGNVQNQAVLRSSANTIAGAVVSWASRFNNVASGDLTITSNQQFALSNGIYKIEWGLPWQQASTYNSMQLQENTAGTWNPFLNDAGYANVGNGGNTDWGGGTFVADIVDCSSSTRTFRLLNFDGSRQLYYGASLIITKLNPAITTSTTADNLGNHTATKNIQLNGNYISNDGDNEGIRIDNTGKVGIGNNSPTQALDVTGNVNVTGKINVTDPSGNVTTKAAAFVNAGLAVTLGEIQVQMATGGSRSLQIKTTGTSFTGMVSAYSTYYGGSFTYFSDLTQTVNATFAYIGTTWSFLTDGDVANYFVRDTTNSRFYRITLMVGFGYNNNFISIERLL